LRRKNLLQPDQRVYSVEEIVSREYLPTQGQDDSSSTEGVIQYTVLYKTFCAIAAISGHIELFV